MKQHEPKPFAQVAVDSTDVEAYARKFRSNDPDRADYDATWGHRTAKNSVADDELFYGYKIHAVCDAHYGFPLVWKFCRPISMTVRGFRS